MWTTLGFDAQKRFFETGVQTHAYLFYGQDRIGKKMFARELAGRIAHSDDIISVETDIDAIREAKRYLSLSPLHGDYKVVLIDNAHRMQEEAQNALLKILEEPSASSILFLISSQPSALLATVTSRCQQMYFPTHDRSIVREFLKSKQLTREQEDFLTDFSNGSIGLLASIGDFSNIRRITEEFATLAKMNLDARFDAAKKLAGDESLRDKILYWMLYLRTRKIYKPLPGLLELYRTVCQPQFNEQLALENFMLTM